jgi:NADP-dependent 3-hydroxy acid dehydrogenase YdfG
MYLKDKVVIVTGASRGIGRASALEFAYQGARVAVGARSKVELDALVAEIHMKYKSKSIAVEVDVARKIDVTTLVGKTIREFGRVDVLVNNAGMGIYGDVAEITEDDFDTMVDVNFKGVFLATKAVLPTMIKQKSGHVITVSSVAGKRPIPKMAVYSGTKYALDGFCKSLAKEVKPYNIRVSVIYPGMVDTYFREKMTNRPTYNSEERSRMLTSEDIARAIVFIANQTPTSMIDELEIAAPLF